MPQGSVAILTKGGEEIVDYRSAPAAKITLFRKLFRGRDDVYPRRFESRKTGKSGYQPACANEWARGLCEKPKVKCIECPHRRFLPVTDDVIRWHLSGQEDNGRDFIMGVYPMLLDETCFFLAADFDKTNWREDVKAWNRDSDFVRSNHCWTKRPPLRTIPALPFADGAQIPFVHAARRRGPAAERFGHAEESPHRTAGYARDTADRLSRKTQRSARTAQWWYRTADRSSRAAKWFSRTAERFYRAAK